MRCCSDSNYPHLVAYPHKTWHASIQNTVMPYGNQTCVFDMKRQYPNHWMRGKRRQIMSSIHSIKNESMMISKELVHSKHIPTWPRASNIDVNFIAGCTQPNCYEKAIEMGPMSEIHNFYLTN